MKKTVLITGACINTGVAIVEKFASEGWDVVFTGRKLETVEKSQAEYTKKFPAVKIIGYAIDSLIDERTVDEDAVNAMFSDLDAKGIFVDTLVLNAADQGLGIEIFKNYFLLVVLCAGGLALLCAILLVVYNAKMRSFLKKIEGENRDK